MHILQSQMPTRAVCIGRDSTVRVITPSTGAVLTTYLADRKTGKGIQDVTYASADGKEYD